MVLTLSIVQMSCSYVIKDVLYVAVTGLDNLTEINISYLYVLLISMV